MQTELLEYYYEYYEYSFAVCIQILGEMPSNFPQM